VVKEPHHECDWFADKFLCGSKGCARAHHVSLHDPAQAQQQKDHPNCRVMTMDTTTEDHDKFSGKV